MMMSYLGLVVGGLLHNLAEDLVLELLVLVAVGEDDEGALHVHLVLDRRQVAHEAHDAGETLEGDLVQLRELHPHQGVVNHVALPLHKLNLKIL